MARHARLESPTSYYHVMIRGNNREFVFLRREQKARYLEALAEEVEEGSIALAAWCLMDNHVHLVVKADLSSLAAAMKSVNTSYAMSFNLYEERIGHVFQDRFRSEIVRDDRHLLTVIRYVHNNPRKAGLVTDAAGYPWSSYGGYLYSPSLIGSEQRELVMGYFAESVSAFAAFHDLPDDEEHLDIREDQLRDRVARGQQIVDAYCRQRGVSKAEVSADRQAADELILRLLDSTMLSHREIASLVGLARSRVHRASSPQ